MAAQMNMSSMSMLLLVKNDVIILSHQSYQEIKVLFFFALPCFR